MVRIVYFILLLVVVTPRVLWGQWEQLPGPAGVTAHDFSQTEVSGGILMATDNGVWLSNDSLKSWTSSGLQGLSVRTLFTDTQSASQPVIYAAAQTYSDGAQYYWLFCPQILFRSLDDGQTWDSVSSFTTSVVGMGRYNQNLFLATNDGIYTSSDGGTAWEMHLSYPRGQNITIPNTREVVLCGDALIAAGHYMFNDSQFFAARCQFDSSNWVPVKPSSGEMTNLWKSGDTVWMGQIKPIYYVSFDSGITWHSDSSATGPGKWENSRWLATEDYYPFPVAGAFVQDLSVSGQNLFALTLQGIYRSTDEGMTWSFSPTSETREDSLYPLGSSAGEFYNANGNLFVAGRGLKVWDGNQWVLLTDTAILSFAARGNAIFLGYPGNEESTVVAKSTDTGKTWIDISPPQGVGEAGAAFLADSGDECFVVEEGWYFEGENALYLTTNEGASWVEKNVPALGYPHTFLFGPASIVFGGEGGVWISKDSGQSWDSLETAQSVMFMKSIPMGFIAGTADSGDYQGFSSATSLSFVSLDGAITTLASGDTYSSVQSFAMDDRYAYMATASCGLWRAPLSDLGVNEREAVPVISSALSIYPNPTSSQSTISFSLPDREPLSLAVYDDLGIGRAHLFEGQLDAGNHTLPIVLPNLPNGIYEVVLQSPINRSAARLLVQR
jgi:photosystem II stability/assembly factor-like uncharacterized protein